MIIVIPQDRLLITATTTKHAIMQDRPSVPVSNLVIAVAAIATITIMSNAVLFAD